VDCNTPYAVVEIKGLPQATCISPSPKAVHKQTPTQQHVALIAKLCACAGVVQLLNSGHLPHDFWDWDFSAGFSWGPDADEEEAQPAEAAAGKHRC